jgi:serine/threonine protein phosphatase PrpC
MASVDIIDNNCVFQISSLLDGIINTAVQNVVKLTVDIHTSDIKNEVYKEACTKQLDRKQDFSKVGSGKYIETDETFDYIVIADGHGKDINGKCTVIDFLRELNWEHILSNNTDPINAILDLLASHNAGRSKRTGSTLSLARIFKNRCETWNIGDSMISIYVDGLLSYTSPTHTLENPAERKRIEDRGLKIVKDNAYKTIACEECNEIMSRQVDITLFDISIQLTLSPTQSIGHAGLTGIIPEYNILEYDPSQHIRVVAFSDGFSDMFCDVEQDHQDLQTKTATELVEKAEMRWSQLWKVYTKQKDSDEYEYFGESSFGSADDISVAVWDNRQKI